MPKFGVRQTNHLLDGAECNIVLEIRLDEDENLIDDKFMHTYVDKFCTGIIFTRDSNPLIPIQFNLSDNCLSKFAMLKVIEFHCRSSGITDEMFKGCDRLTTLLLGTPIDKPLKTFDNLINLPELKHIYINGYGLADLSDEFVEWYKENNKHKKHPYVVFMC